MAWRPVKRIDADTAIEETVIMLANAEFMHDVLNFALSLQASAPDPARVEQQRAVRAESEALAREVRSLEAQLLAQVPRLDPKDLLDLICRTFSEFQFLTFVQKRVLLRGALKQITVSGHARAITTVTISGGYLGKGVNSVLHSKSRSRRRFRGPW